MKATDYFKEEIGIVNSSMTYGCGTCDEVTVGADVISEDALNVAGVIYLFSQKNESVAYSTICEVLQGIVPHTRINSTVSSMLDILEELGCIELGWGDIDGYLTRVFQMADANDEDADPYIHAALREQMKDKNSTLQIIKDHIDSNKFANLHGRRKELGDA